MNSLLPLVKIDSMSSIEIAELTGKQHPHVLRDIRTLLSELYQDNPNKETLENINLDNQNPNLDSIEIKGVFVAIASNGMTKHIDLDKHHTLVLVTGYSAKMRDAVIKRWQYLEDQLETLKSSKGTKKLQLEAMEALSHLLPENLTGEALSYIKANTVVNKAVCNLFGFPKMIKKADMSPDMISVRDSVLDDYIALYEILGDNATVKNALYDKYQPKRLNYG